MAKDPRPIDPEVEVLTKSVRELVNQAHTLAVCLNETLAELQVYLKQHEGADTEGLNSG